MSRLLRGGVEVMHGGDAVDWKVSCAISIPVKLVDELSFGEGKTQAVVGLGVIPLAPAPARSCLVAFFSMDSMDGMDGMGKKTIIHIVHFVHRVHKAHQQKSKSRSMSKITIALSKKDLLFQFHFTVDRT